MSGLQFYRPRPIRHLEVLSGGALMIPDAKLKLYGVTAREGQETPREEIIKAAKAVITFDRLGLYERAESSIPQSKWRIFVACVNEANGADFLLLGRWDGNVLHTEVHELEMDRRNVGRIKGRWDTEKQPIPLCTWDLAILAFERNAWIEKVLKNPTTAGIESYLSCVLNTTI